MRNCPHERTALRDRFLGENKHVERFCLGCDKHLGFVKQEITPAKAQAFRMPFGKHEGKLLEEIPRDYLNWCLRELKPNYITRVIQTYLDFFPPNDGRPF